MTFLLSSRKKPVGWVGFFTRPNIARTLVVLGLASARPNLRCADEVIE
jgi:hypothetical protein